MTLPETVKLLAVISEVYPKFMEGRQIETTATIWQKIFADENYKEVEGAFFAFVSTDEKGFPPPPGALRSLLNKLKQPDGETTEAEAWALVQKAVRNSNYNAEKEFAALPEEIQRCVGSPATLREWAIMDTETFNSVVASNFMRSYKVRAVHVREMQKLPAPVREIFGLIGDAFKMPAGNLEAPKQATAEPGPEEEPTEQNYRSPEEGWKLAKARVEELRAQREKEKREKNERMAEQLGL